MAWLFSYCQQFVRRAVGRLIGGSGSAKGRVPLGSDLDRGFRAPRMREQPDDDLVGALVRRKDRIEHFLDPTIGDDQRQAL